MFIWCENINGVLWLIPARNFKSTDWVRATAPSGIFAVSSGGLSLTAPRIIFITIFSSKSMENIIWIPDGAAKWPISFVFFVVWIMWIIPDGAAKWISLQILYQINVKHDQNPWRCRKMTFITILISSQCKAWSESLTVPRNDHLWLYIIINALWKGGAGSSAILWTSLMTVATGHLIMLETSYWMVKVEHSFASPLHQ